jgi:integrase
MTTAVQTGAYVDPAPAKVQLDVVARQWVKAKVNLRPTTRVRYESAVLRNRNARRGWFDAAATAIGEQGLTPYELRHTAARLAVSAGANVKAVQRTLGHACPRP